MINDEAGGRDEEIIHPIKASAERLGVDGVVGHTPAGLLDHLAHTPREEGGVFNMEIHELFIMFACTGPDSKSQWEERCVCVLVYV